MSSLSYYQENIINVTGCKPEDAEEIENYMRDVIFHSTLDWQSKAQFNKGAKTAYKHILYLRSPEGVRYLNELNQ